MTPIIVDVEASGFGKGSYPIEIGLVLPDGTPHCFLLAPARHWTAWEPEAEKLHGISRETLEAYGRPLQEVAWRLNELLRDKTVYSDAWSFDMCWLGKLFDAAHMPQTFRVAPLQEALGEHQMEKWDNAKAKVIEELDLQRHRASGDARILQETYRRTERVAA